MRRAASAAGHANLIIVNTCAVTGEAVAQARQSIRRLARQQPVAPIVVTGCAAQTETATFAAMPEVARVLGNADKCQSETWAGLLDPAGERVAVNDIMATRETALHLLDGFDGRTRAYLMVQNGCDHRCTFCIIPYGRGPSRSVPMGEVVAQARRLVAEGYREIVLTGVDLTSYGADLPGAPALGVLVRQVLRHVPELPRLRLSSIDAVEADPALCAAFAEEARLMPHLHLSLQAGDDLILKRMKRRHNRAEAVRFCADMRRLRPDMVFGADLIAGFPTEDEAMAERSLALVEECGLTHLHVFPFSPRPGTPAARMPAVPPPLVKARAARLRAAGAAALARHLAGEVGQRRAVLAEQGGRGRTEGFALVRLPPHMQAGEIHTVTITGHDGRQMLAA
jgi:threonylcarbamoyladenosine tRNA methylthiotransferase MtaB